MAQIIMMMAKCVGGDVEEMAAAYEVFMNDLKSE